MGGGQVLLYRVLTAFPQLALGGGEAGGAGEGMDSRCMDSLREYLRDNRDCTRLRGTVEKYLDHFHPLCASTPRGMFVIREDAAKVPPSLLLLLWMTPVLIRVRWLGCRARRMTRLSVFPWLSSTALHIL